MKIFSFFAVSALAEKGRPDTIDADKRLEKLGGMVSGCLALDFYTSNAKKHERLTKKFAKLAEIAQRYVEKAGNRPIEEDTNEVRINTEDPCSCLGILYLPISHF